MTTTEQIINVCLGVFSNTDSRQWDQLEALLAPQVLLDYSSLSGQPAATMSPQQITAAWQQVLPGFDQTHHQIGNIVVAQRDADADLFCYGTATHYLAGQPGGFVWTVVGTYDFHLVRQAAGWHVDRLRLNFKYQDGNLELPKRAGERAAHPAAHSSR